MGISAELGQRVIYILPDGRKWVGLVISVNPIRTSIVNIICWDPITGSQQFAYDVQAQVSDSQFNCWKSI